jgi:hypothetical protein
MKKAELIERYWKAKEEKKIRDAQASDRLMRCSGGGNCGKTQVHIPVELIEAEQAEYAEYWATASEVFQKCLPPTLTADKAKSRVQEFINDHFFHHSSLLEYSEYRNSITFEVKRFRNRRSR